MFLIFLLPRAPCYKILRNGRLFLGDVYRDKDEHFLWVFAWRIHWRAVNKLPEMLESIVHARPIRGTLKVFMLYMSQIMSLPSTKFVDNLSKMSFVLPKYL
jgi:hypothetical protein